MQLMSSCIYLGGQPFVSRYSSEIGLRFLELVGNVRDGAYRIIATTMEVLLRVAPDEGARLLGKTLVKLSKELLQPCPGDSGLASGPNTIVFSAVIGVFSRITLWAPTCLLEMLTNASVAAEFGITNGMYWSLHRLMPGYNFDQILIFLFACVTNPDPFQESKNEEK